MQKPKEHDNMICPTCGDGLTPMYAGGEFYGYIHRVKNCDDAGKQLAVPASSKIVEFRRP